MLDTIYNFLMLATLTWLAVPVGYQFAKSPSCNICVCPGSGEPDYLNCTWCTDGNMPETIQVDLASWTNDSGCTSGAEDCLDLNASWVIPEHPTLGGCFHQVAILSDICTASPGTATVSVSNFSTAIHGSVSFGVVHGLNFISSGESNPRDCTSWSTKDIPFSSNSGFAQNICNEGTFKITSL